MIRLVPTVIPAVILAVIIAALVAFAGPVRADDAVHLGVQSCAGNNCHGAVHPIGNSRVPQNEYFIWSQKDKHAQAYAVLGNDRSKRIARNLGIDDPGKAALCLDCHADNVPPAQRGPQFQLSDGVGCESCHGGAENWLGPHLSGESHAANLKAGLYPTDQPPARAERCLSCHLGDDKKFVAHKIMGAGHPPMPFELDTYTAIQPAHFVVNQSYVERKGRPNDIQIWASGLADDVKKRMDLILDPAHAPKGVDFELSLFDCQACHHSMKELQWRARTTTRLPPGRIKLYDATAVMLLIVATNIAPDAGKALGDHMLALHAASGDSWDAVKREAAAIRDIAGKLMPVITGHDFSRKDAIGFGHAVVASALDGNDLDYSGAQQQVMALGSIVAAMKQLGYADDKQAAALDAAMSALYAAVADDQKYDPDGYVAALKAFNAKLPM
ncbi:MAG TPA: multiheme c-type cytochrome [Stellaceae bacterium]|nr:multiheme c-type cytochrome [Stellaceae bacterium]